MPGAPGSRSRAWHNRSAPGDGAPNTAWHSVLEATGAHAGCLPLVVTGVTGVRVTAAQQVVFLVQVRRWHGLEMFPVRAEWSKDFHPFSLNPPSTWTRPRGHVRMSSIERISVTVHWAGAGRLGEVLSIPQKKMNAERCLHSVNSGISKTALLRCRGRILSSSPRTVTAGEGGRWHPSALDSHPCSGFRQVTSKGRVAYRASQGGEIQMPRGPPRNPGAISVIPAPLRSGGRITWSCVPFHGCRAVRPTARAFSSSPTLLSPASTLLYVASSGD